MSAATTSIPYVPDHHFHDTRRDRDDPAEPSGEAECVSAVRCATRFSTRWTQIAADDGIRVLVVTGEGRGFCAGGDIDHLKQLRENKDEQGFREILAKGQKITRTMRALPKPVIAAVNGPCAGAGFSFALGCDIRIASDKATFGPSFALIGLHPDWGGSWFLPRLVGSARACELMFTGRHDHGFGSGKNRPGESRRSARRSDADALKRWRERWPATLRACCGSPRNPFIEA